MRRQAATGFSNRSNELSAHICTTALHSYIFFARCCAASTLISLLPMKGHLHTIHPTWPLPTPYTPSTYIRRQDSSLGTAIIHSSHVSKQGKQVFPLQYSLIYSTRQSISIPALLLTSSFLTVLIHDSPTKLLNMNIYFLSPSTLNTLHFS